MNPAFRTIAGAALLYPIIRRGSGLNKCMSMDREGAAEIGVAACGNATVRNNPSGSRYPEFDQDKWINR